MTYELITVIEKYEGAVTEIIIGPPPANIISARMMDEISNQLTEDKGNTLKKLIIITGSGKHFSFGASVEEHKADKIKLMLPRFHRFIGEIINCSIPTLAKVTGQCLGGGFEMALACTFLFAGKNAKFAVPESQLGVFPPPACILLPESCSSPLSSQIILTGESFTAEYLYQRGLINEISDEEMLDNMVSTFYEKQLAIKSASSLRIAYKASRLVLSEKYNELIGKLEKIYLDELMSTHDANEGIASFLEKRQPQWKNA